MSGNGSDEPKKKYNTLSLCAYSIVVAGAWTYAAASFGTTVYAGGMPVLIYGTIGITIINSLFLVNIAEFASAYPSGGGIPYYSRILAGPEWGRFAEYFVGAIHSMGVCLSPSGALISMVQLFATAGAVMHPDWAPQRWQILLAYEGVNILVVFLILYASKALALLNRLAVVVVFLGLFIVIGFLASHPTQMASNKFVWAILQNDTGFSSDGYCVLLGICIALYAYGVPHWLVNLAEDVKNPSRAIPIALAAQQVGNFVTVFAFLIAVGYAITDYEALVETNYPSAIGVIFLQATGSRGGALGLLLLISIPGLIGLMSYFNTSMMVVYGYIRTKSVPHWDWFVRRHPRTNDPVNILYVLAGINCALGFVYLGSDVGFSILLSSPGALYFFGYLIPLVAHVLTGGRNLENSGWFKLPRLLSVSIAAINILGVSLVVIILCLPREAPITTENMNWDILFLAVACVLAIISWTFYGKYNYESVHIHVVNGLEATVSSGIDEAPTQLTDVADSKKPTVDANC